VPDRLALFCRGARTYLITRFLEGTQPLTHLLATRFARGVSEEEREGRHALLRQLAAWLRGIHDRRIYHDDWSAKNFRGAEDAGRWEFYLLDFESLASWKSLTPRRRAKNLAQLLDPQGGLTEADREPFLAAYAAGDREFLGDEFRRDVSRALARRHEAAGQRRRAREKT